MKRNEHPFIDYEDDYELTEEDEETREVFYGDYSDFIPCPEMAYCDENDIYRYVWDDFQEAKQFVKDNPDVNVYTVIDGEDGSLWISPGWHFVNRISYFFTNHRRPIPDGGCYY